MSKFNKSYRIRTEVGKDKHVHVQLDRDYEILEIMSLKINQENAYKLHYSNYGVIAGRVLANGGFGVPNAKISVFINISKEDIYDTVKSVLYPYNTTISKDKNGVRYNLLPNEQLNKCHTIIGTFPKKQYVLDNDNILEIFDTYYKFTTKTNDAGDYMIFGVPLGSQTIHVDIDLSDIGVLSQKPRDMVYKGYNINQFENPNKFKYDTNLNSLSQVVSQDNIVDVIPFWGDESERSIGITRCDIDVNYKFEPTCVFMGSVVSDNESSGFSTRCIPSPTMGSMEDIVTGSGTIEMIRKTPSGDVEEFQIQGTQLINGDGVWCYQIPMNLDYVMTDEFGNMVPTDNPNKGIPTRTRVRFRLSMQDFDSNNTNIFRGKVLIPHNPLVNEKNKFVDYNFGTETKEESYRDLFWNCIYSVKSYIPRIQKGSNWKNEKFTGFKRVNYHGNNNPIPYNNIRIKIPFMYTMLCILIKIVFGICGAINWFMYIFAFLFGAYSKPNDEKDDVNRGEVSGGFISFSGELCSTDLDYICIIPGLKDKLNNNKKDICNYPRRCSLFAATIVKFIQESGYITDTKDQEKLNEYMMTSNGHDEKSIDHSNRETRNLKISDGGLSDNDKENKNVEVTLSSDIVKFTANMDYFIECIEMNLAKEYKVIQFDFYNDWINGLIYIPRWVRVVGKKRSYFFGLIQTNPGKPTACNENFSSSNMNIVQQCGLNYDSNYKIKNEVGCDGTINNCHKNAKVRKSSPIFWGSGIISSKETYKSQYVYYYKPIEISNNKHINLYATDIILLGSFNECDRMGITNNIEDLVSTTYKMPSNLALTDSDIEGIDYWTKKGGVIKFTYKPYYMQVLQHYNTMDAYVDLSQTEEYGNFTEVSGVNWNYNGPLQLKALTETVDTTPFFKPGGHFLGLSCVNSETTIKSCVNLSRICELGVMMSQRQINKLPSHKNNEQDTVEAYATVPSGLISKDEISGTNYRHLFATMNSKPLLCNGNLKDSTTGYPVYDFKYTYLTNFGGELSDFVNKKDDKDKYNRKIIDTGSIIENRVQYTDNNYYDAEKIGDGNEISEYQIMRTGETKDDEYLNFRLGNDPDKRFLLKINNKYDSFPLYKNSFYFYFGLHVGKSALDELKKNYYAVCEKIDNNLLNQKTIEVYIKEIEPSNLFGEGGSITIGANNLNLSSSADSIKIFQNGNEISKPKETNSNLNTITITDLNEGVYTLKINVEKPKFEFEEDFKITKPIYTIEPEGVDFKKFVTKSDFYYKKEKNNSYEAKDLIEYGGYISIPTYKIDLSKDENWNKSYDKIIVIDITDKENEENEKVEKEQIILEGDVLKYSRNGTLYYSQIFDLDSEILIPVPLPNKIYKIQIRLFIHNREYSFNNEKITISEPSKINCYYCGVPMSNDAFKTSDEEYEWWIPNNEGWNLMNEFNPELMLFVKKSLYKQSDGKHRVDIKHYGGTPPLTIKINGKEYNGFNFDDVQEVTINNVQATINNETQQIQTCLTYQVSDNFQTVPKEPFSFPIIYKPFFMELILLMYKDNQCRLIGDIYNGISYQISDGFNDTKLNNVNFDTIVISKEDYVMEITKKYDETTTIEDNGGYDYNGYYNMYNGRRTFVDKTFDGSNFNISNKPNFKINFSIGSMHNDTVNNITHKGTTTDISLNDVPFIKQTTKLKKVGDVFNLECITNSNDITKYILTTSDTLSNIISNKEDDYEKLINLLLTGYLTNNKTDNETDKSTIKIITNINETNTLNYAYFISKIKKINKTSSSTLNKLQPIFISNEINCDYLRTYYSSPINISGVDKIVKDSIKTTLTIEYCESLKDKKVIINFNDKLKKDITLPDQASYSFELSNEERSSLGINNTKDTENNNTISIKYNYYFPDINLNVDEIDTNSNCNIIFVKNE